MCTTTIESRASGVKNLAFAFVILPQAHSAPAVDILGRGRNQGWWQGFVVFSIPALLSWTIVEDNM